MKYIILILAILLLIAGAYIYIQHRAASLHAAEDKSKLDQLALASAHHQAELKIAKQAVIDKHTKFKADSVAAAHVQDSLERVASRLVAIFNSNKGVPKDTTKCCQAIPVIVHKADSAIEAQAVLITNLKDQKQTTFDDMNVLLALEQKVSQKSDSGFMAEQARRIHLEGVEEQLEDERGKEFGISLGGGYVSTVHDGTVIAKPGVSVGVTWTPRWLRFSLKRKR